MKLKIRKATKHERKNLLKPSGSEGALYSETPVIVIDTTKSRLNQCFAIIHEMCHVLGMDDREADAFTSKAMKVVMKK